MRLLRVGEPGRERPVVEDGDRWFDVGPVTGDFSGRFFDDGGVGLCEAVQHLSMFDFVAVSGTVEDRYLEYVDHLHEHVVVPTDVRQGRYWPPSASGEGMEMLATSVQQHLHAG